ncbi:MAG: substrate-binding domain-containing protein [Tannerella sp.]|jgi:phosphate transport system substrate-binding protein|nr:substrate-binding domain-containing protein [Tannerella sp.]
MKYIFLSFMLLSACLFFSCSKEENENFRIEGLTMENYPFVDGSTSTAPLNNLIACKLLGYKYEWQQAWVANGLWQLTTDLPYEFVSERIKSSQTHNSFINLIDNKAEIILSARKMSDDEKQYAENAGVTLIETPVALDAFIFITNKENKIKSLTINQIQDIYTSKIRNWQEVGGSDNPINPYVRNANSGSQELMESLVMKNIEISIFPEDYESEIPGMLPVFSTLRNDVNGLCYTVYYYKEQLVREDVVKSLAVNGIYPDKKTIKRKEYPLVAEVYAVIRSDLDKSSAAYKIYELLQTKEGKVWIEESGYIPYN